MAFPRLTAFMVLTVLTLAPLTKTLTILTTLQRTVETPLLENFERQQNRADTKIKILEIVKIKVDRRTHRVTELHIKVLNDGKTAIDVADIPEMDLILGYLRSDGTHYYRWIPHRKLAESELWSGLLIKNKPYWEITDVGALTIENSGVTIKWGTEIFNPNVKADERDDARGKWDAQEAVYIKIFFDKKDPNAPYYYYPAKPKPGQLVGGYFTVIIVTPNGIKAEANSFTVGVIEEVSY